MDLDLGARPICVLSSAAPSGLSAGARQNGCDLHRVCIETKEHGPVDPSATAGDPDASSTSGDAYYKDYKDTFNVKSVLQTKFCDGRYDAECACCICPDQDDWESSRPFLALPLHLCQ